MAYDLGPITDAEWAKHRSEAMQTLPPALAGRSIPDILLKYQKELLVSTSTYALTATDKSRRIGATWAVGADAVLTSGSARSAGGMDTLYIGYNLDMAREFIDVCAMWAKAFMPACTEVGEFLFVDSDPDGASADKHIQAFRIRFASGYEIVALSSRPRSLRGRQGYVILDEFAFHDDAPGLLKACFALRIHGGKILVISTHNGVDNPFNELLNDIRAGKLGKSANIMRATFDDAIEQGLYERICLKGGKPWSAEAEAEWRSEIRMLYGANAAEELDCVPSQGSGVYLTRAVIEACATETGPVLQLHCPQGFELRTEAERRSYVEAWLEQVVEPELAKLDRNLRHFFGHDFARSGHVSGFGPLYIDRDLRRRFPFLIEMRNVPHEQQKQVLFHVIDRLPRFGGGKMDATGNGSFLAEVVMQRYGIERIEQVKLSQGWYIDNMPPLKAAFEDRNVGIPRHPDVVDDVRQIKILRGVAQVPRDAETKGSDGLLRHGDFAVTIAMGLAAANDDVEEFGYQPVAKRRVAGARDDFSRFHDDDMPASGLRFAGTW